MAVRMQHILSKIVVAHTGFEWGSSIDVLAGTGMRYFIENGATELMDENSKPFEAKIGHLSKKSCNVRRAKYYTLL